MKIYKDWNNMTEEETTKACNRGCRFSSIIGELACEHQIDGQAAVLTCKRRKIKKLFG